MPLPTPEQFYQRWSQRLGESADRYRAGITATQVNPMELAAANADGWLAGVQRAHREQRYQNALRNVSIQDWKNAAINVGAGRLVDGATKARRKVVAFWQFYRPIMETVQTAVRAMPRATYEQRRARAIAMMDGLHNSPYRGNRGGAGAVGIPGI